MTICTRLSQKWHRMSERVRGGLTCLHMDAVRSPLPVVSGRGALKSPPAHVAKGEQNEPCRLVEPDPVRRTPGRGQVMMLPGLQVTQLRILSVRSRRALVRWVQLGGDRGGASSPHTHCHLVSVTRPVTWLGPVPANTGHVDFILKAPPL